MAEIKEALVPDIGDYSDIPVIEVLVAVGDTVKKGQPLIIMEAMKMEHTIVAPFDGAVEAIYFAAKEQVKEGAELVALSDGSAASSLAIVCTHEQNASAPSKAA